MFESELSSGMTNALVNLGERVGELERKENPAASGIGPFEYEIHVDIGGGGDYTSIKAAADYVLAIAQADEYWTIVVHAGDYTENAFELPDNCSMVGVGYVSVFALSISGTYITLGDNCTIRNIAVTLNMDPTSVDCWAIECAGYLTLENCTILVNRFGGSGSSQTIGVLKTETGNVNNCWLRLRTQESSYPGARIIARFDDSNSAQRSYLRDCTLGFDNDDPIEDDVSVAVHLTTHYLWIIDCTIQKRTSGAAGYDIQAAGSGTVYTSGTLYVKSTGTVTNLDTAAGAGGVTSVGLTVPAIFNVSPPTITSSGTFAITTASQLPFRVWARGSGTGLPTFQVLQSDHIPTLDASKIVVGALLANVGGTGFSSYAVGDMLYADTTSTLARLPDAVAGNALISGGVDTAPAWDKIGLTTHVSGTLGTINGGTGLSTIAADHMPYASALDVYSTTPLTAFGRSLIDDANAADARTTLELIAGGAGDIWVLRAGDTMTGNLSIVKALTASMTVNSTGSAANLILQSDTANANLNFNAAGQAQLNWQKVVAGTPSARWLALMTSTTESGSNVGSNWQLLRRTDAGGSLGQPVFAIERSTGFIGVHRAEATAAYTVDVLGTFRVDSTTGGVATLYRTSNIATANLVIGRLEFANNDSDLSTQNLFGYIEVQSAAGISSDAARGKMLFAVTPNTAASAPVVRLTIEEDGRIHGSALHNNAGAVTGATNQYLASGTYTPTLTNVANLAASTAYQCQWSRVGNVVTVSGKVDVDPTLTATSTQLGISLPIASNLATAQDLGGCAFASGITGQGAAILADTTNDRAQMQWLAGDVTNQAMFFVFVYEVL